MHQQLMRQHAICSLWALALCVAFASEATAQFFSSSLSGSSQKTRVMATGDSHTECLTLAFSDCWLSVVEASMPYLNMRNAGCTGATAAVWADDATQSACILGDTWRLTGLPHSPEQADIAIIMLGTNDALNTQPTKAAFKADMATLIARFGQATLVVINKPPLLPTHSGDTEDNLLSSYADAVQEIADASTTDNIEFGINAYDGGILSSDDDFEADNIHMDVSGHAAFGAAMVTRLQALRSQWGNN